jgi:CubicO group peptidase (beta-lactamase class C family)
MRLSHGFDCANLMRYGRRPSPCGNLEAGLDIRYHRKTLSRQARPVRRLGLSLALGVLFLGIRVPLHADDFVNGRLGEYLESLRVQTGIPGLAVTVVGRSEVLYERGFGYDDLERNILIRGDTPMHVDGLTEMLAASLVMRCVEQGRLSLDNTIGQFKPSVSEPNLTLRQILTHTGDGSYSYRPDRVNNLGTVIRTCTDDSYRETLANLLDQNGMADSVPGPDVIYLVPPAEGVLTSEFERYSRILGRLPIPYAVDAQKKASRTSYSATTLSPTSGLIATVHDLAKFDIGLKNGFVMQKETLAAAWRASGGPHGIGWFVQSYNGENVVWQFGSGENGSSAMFITLPSRSVTLILTANSNGLVKGFGLSAGDILASPFARAFLGLFAV